MPEKVIRHVEVSEFKCNECSKVYINEREALHCERSHKCKCEFVEHYLMDNNWVIQLCTFCNKKETITYDPDEPAFKKAVWDYLVKVRKKDNPAREF